VSIRTVRLTLAIALGVAFGIALIPLAWRLVRAIERGTSLAAHEVAAVRWRKVASATFSLVIAISLMLFIRELTLGQAAAVTATVPPAVITQSDSFDRLDSIRDACTQRDSHVCTGAEWQVAEDRRHTMHRAAVAAHSHDSAEACARDPRDSALASGKYVLTLCGFIRDGRDTVVFP
jgi:hypothetical protein